ncbi:MAG: LOG family protein [Candidatus Gracilibacteria bacterium]|jgi:hypothetical protein
MAIKTQKELKKKHFRVAIFGSARALPESDDYKQVYALAYEIGASGLDIVTGGGPGLMEAAGKGFAEGKKSTSKNSHNIGLTVKLAWEFQKNKYLDIEKNFEKFSDRLDEFMELSNIVVISPGGVGTCLEFFYTWQLTQVKHICNIPIIMLGDMWNGLTEWLKKWPLEKGYISDKDLSNLHCAENYEKAFKYIQRAHELYKQLGDSYCLNWKKYKLD